jgi:hypothetical protein
MLKVTASSAPLVKHRKPNKRNGKRPSLRIKPILFSQITLTPTPKWFKINSIFIIVLGYSYSFP